MELTLYCSEGENKFDLIIGKINSNKTAIYLEIKKIKIFTCINNVVQLLIPLLDFVLILINNSIVISGNFIDL